MLSGNILVTGGSGFLARSIYRRAQAEAWPASFTCLSRSEARQWELRQRFPKVRCVLGDVASPIDHLADLFAGHDLVVHAGALKHIGEVEKNRLEAVRINIEGSRNVGLAARIAGVRKVVGISTDKACEPETFYGLTKAVMEGLFAELDASGGTRFACVRYGNVVGSTGSVIPLFRRQLAETGALRVTDPRMTRFWLSADEAVDLIVRAFEYEKPYYEEPYDARGLTFIGRNPAMAIVDLAEAVWLESGGDGPAPVAFVGAGITEKLTEELYSERESPRIGVAWPDGFVLYPSTRKTATSDAKPLRYASDAPSRWLSVSEMRELIRDAETV